MHYIYMKLYPCIAVSNKAFASLVSQSEYLRLKPESGYLCAGDVKENRIPRALQLLPYAYLTVHDIWNLLIYRVQFVWRNIAE